MPIGLDVNLDEIRDKLVYTIMNGGLATGQGLIPIVVAVALPALVGNAIKSVGYSFRVSELLGVNSVTTPAVDQGAGMFASLVVLIGYMYVLNEDSLIHDVNFEIKHLAWVVVGFVGLILVNSGLSFVSTLFDVAIGQNIGVSDSPDNPLYFLYLVPVMILFVGPLEELMFRGLLQGSYRQYFSKTSAVLTAGIVFGAFHFTAIDGSALGTLVYILITVALGIILGFIYERTENIFVPMLVHGLYNSLLLIIRYNEETMNLITL